jgi:glycosyltransferase involved in cell wall biosynthesis
VLHQPLPALAARAPCPQVVTLHDLAFERLPEQFAPAFRRWASRSHRRAAHGAGAVVCVSQTTRLDAMARWGLDGARIVVAPHGPGQQPSTVAARAEHFLYVGDDEPRKNLGLLLEAYARYRDEAGPAALGLVLAGRARIDHDGVRCEANPNLGLLLGGAAALVQPALYEGFGLTALEAMSAGVAVIAARSPGLAETCGDAALYVDPYAGAAPLALALRAVATQPALRAELVRRGSRRAAGFSWQASARAHLVAYELARARRAPTAAL